MKAELFFEHCAISNTNADFIDFWSCSDEFLNSLTLEEKLYYLRKSSLDKKQVERSCFDNNVTDRYIKCYKTRCLRLSDIIDKYFPDKRVDLIFIDAEGRDDEVIKTIDFKRCTPNAIFYESHNLGSRNERIEEYLSNKGFNITQLGGDSVAVNKF